MLRRILLVLLLLFAPASAFANDLEGSWALRIDEANIFRFDLREISDGVWRGTWTRPDRFRSNGAVFTQMEGSEELDSMAGLDASGEVELSFDDPRPGAVPDIFRFSLVGEGQVAMTYVGTGMAPYPLVRVARDAPLGPFEDGRIYDRDNAQTIPDPLEEPAEEPSLPSEEEAAAEEITEEEPASLDNFWLEDEDTPSDDPAPADEAVEQIEDEPDALEPETEAEEQWQPDASVRAAIEARARSLEDNGVEEVAEPEVETEQQTESEQEEAEEPQSLLGDDFLEGL